MRISDWSSDVCSSDLVTELARMKPLIVDQAQVERGLGLMKGEEAPFVARERRQRPALKILPEMLRDEEDAGDQRIARRLLADTRNRGLILEHVKRSEERRVGKEGVSTCKSRGAPSH